MKEEAIEHVIKTKTTRQGTEVLLDGKIVERIERFEISDISRGVPILNLNFMDGKYVKPSKDGSEWIES